MSKTTTERWLTPEERRIAAARAREWPRGNGPDFWTRPLPEPIDGRLKLNDTEETVHFLNADPRIRRNG